MFFTISTWKITILMCFSSLGLVSCSCHGIHRKPLCTSVAANQRAHEKLGHRCGSSVKWLFRRGKNIAEVSHCGVETLGNGHFSVCLLLRTPVETSSVITKEQFPFKVHMQPARWTPSMRQMWIGAARFPTRYFTPASRSHRKVYMSKYKHPDVSVCEGTHSLQVNTWY